ncbi:MAG: GatB/YqeY domain-containing protein [Alphaproteobacteria bacterium]
MKDRLHLAILEAETLGDTPFVQTLRLIATVLEDQGFAANDIEENSYSVIRQIIAYHQERLDIFQATGSHKNAKSEKAMIQKLENLLPKTYSEDSLHVIIDEKITACGARSIRDLKTVMTLLRQECQGNINYEQAKSIAIGMLR